MDPSGMKSAKNILKSGNFLNTLHACPWPKIHVFGRVVIENPLNIFIFAGFIFAIMTPTRKSQI
jgi:hypothetical protein